MARWMKREPSRTRFFSTTVSGSKPLTSPAIWEAKLSGSKRVIRSIPLSPRRSDLKLSSALCPFGLTAPTPVMTTLRMRHTPLNDRTSGPPDVKGRSPKGSGAMLFDVADRILHGLDLLRVLVGDFDLELLFER